MENKRNIEIKLSKDGSHTLYVSALDEHYHSVNGALNESMHVFIEAGLNQVLEEEINILEFGFGTGLNTLLSLIYGKKKVIHYHAMEKYPVEPEVLEKLNYTDLIKEKYDLDFKLMHKVSWEQEHKISRQFYLTKMQCDFKHVKLEQRYHLIYFDAFAPEVQPKLWTKDIFVKAYEALLPGGVLITYCAKGIVRRTMQEVGFKVERLPGPPGKREMLRAMKP